MKINLLFSSILIFVILLISGCGGTKAGEKSLLNISKTDLISFTEKSVSPSHIEINLSNYHTEKLIWGSWFTIEKKTGGEWHEIELIPPEPGIDRTWTAEEVSLESGGKRTIEAYWTHLYGELSKGEYRFIKPFWFNNTDEDDEMYISCEFII